MLIIYFTLFIVFLFITRTYKRIVVPKPPPITKPPMGWNSWTCFKTSFNDKMIKEIADVMDSDFKSSGYEYLILDDGWMSLERDRTGNLQADPEKFPLGMKELGDYIHSKGLKFGIYTSVGRYTCEGYPGSFDFEDHDAAKFAEWGVDYVKLDWCTYKWTWWPFWNYQLRYELMSKAIQATGRPMVIALCNWGFGKPWTWGRKIAHTWRVTYDINPTKFSIYSIASKGYKLFKYTRPGEYNDLDSLEVGNGIGTELAKKQFYWWCTLKSPLILGCDLRTMSDEDKSIVKNMELINLNQS